MARQDYLKDESGDLLIQNGDFVVGESDHQHINDIIIASPGDYRQYPDVGFNAIRFLNSVGRENQFKSELRAALENDGYKVRKIDTSKGIENFEIDARS